MAIAVAWAVGAAWRHCDACRRGAAARCRQPGPVGHRGSYRKKLRPCSKQLNRLLARLEVAFGAQRAFVADAAHELRSPLTAVRLQLQLLDRAPDEEARRTARAELGAAVERAIHLVEQLLALARSEPQDARLELQAVPLEAVAAEAIRDTHALALAKQIELQLSAEPEAVVRGDPEALRTLVRNLVDNAVRYTPAGGQVRVRTRREASGAQLQVSDSGPGMPPTERARAFDRFYRRANSPAGGCGLGLAIVRAIAERHGARVMLDEAPGGGLQATVAFPSLP